MCAEHLALVFVSQKLVVRDWSVQQVPTVPTGWGCSLPHPAFLRGETRNGGASVVRSAEVSLWSPCMGLDLLL